MVLSYYVLILLLLPFPEKMLTMGFTQKEINESLTESRYDEVCATYMLLMRDDMVRTMSSRHHVQIFIMSVEYLHFVNILSYKTL